MPPGTVPAALPVLPPASTWVIGPLPPVSGGEDPATSWSPSGRQPAGADHFSIPLLYSCAMDSRADMLDVGAETLLGRASRLTRLLMGSGSRQLSRTEAGLLTTLAGGPR